MAYHLHKQGNSMKQYTTIDKTDWPVGEWINEPDKVQYIDENTSLDCLIVRTENLGHLCGYVGVPESNPHYEQDFDRPINNCDVHGGLTFAGFCDPSEDESIGLCHTGDVANEKVWWLGFDCYHAGDKSPTRKQFYDFEPEDEYRNIGYVKAEIRNLAKQLSGG